MVKVEPCQRDASTYSHILVDSSITLRSPERLSPGCPLLRVDARVGGEIMASHETFNDLGCSSSEEDSNRADMAEGTAEQEKKTSPAAARRRHPFSVEALMSGRKTDGESTGFKPEASVSPLGLNSLYLCREACSLPGGSRKSLTAAPSSPVKSEASESEECAPWVTSSAFSTQPRK